MAQTPANTVYSFTKGQRVVFATARPPFTGHTGVVRSLNADGSAWIRLAATPSDERHELRVYPSSCIRVKEG